MSEFALSSGKWREKAAKREVFVRQFRGLLEACAIRQAGAVFMEQPGTVENTICIPDLELDWLTYSFTATCDVEDFKRPFGPDNRAVYGGMSRSSRTLIKGNPCPGPDGANGLLSGIVNEGETLAMVTQSTWVVGQGSSFLHYENTGLATPFDESSGVMFEQDLKEPLKSPGQRLGRLCLRTLRSCTGRPNEGIVAGDIAEVALMYEAANLNEIANAFGVDDSRQLVDISVL